MTTLALIGNPNCGKTTVFNALTGTRQRVGNWPGVTVEKKTGHFAGPQGDIELIDLPGTYSIASSAGGIDEAIARDYVHSADADVVINIVDASSLSRGLYLTSELMELDAKLVVVLNMMDVAQQNGVDIDVAALAEELKCPVVPLVASKQKGIDELKAAIDAAATVQPLGTFSSDSDRYAAIDSILGACATLAPPARSISQRIDDVVLNPYLAFPIFLGVMYLMFLFSINVGSAFIDFFDLTGSVIFVEGPRQILTAIGLPAWLVIFIADGVGGGVQLVGTFIPVIASLFLVLSLLEDSGYMARVAFIVDRLLRSLGLPGKSFVPLIVGFGCNVPAVMATRSLDSQPDRILTTLMAPYMSCGARLTVYALFAAAFFPSNGQNIVFALYLIGIFIAVLSALAVRKHLMAEGRSPFVLELPAYHLPTLKGMFLQTWQRLMGFVLRAGKAIIAVVIILNVVSSIGTDGSVGNEDTDRSVLSAIGKTITPMFSPMGISEDNWPATVGIFAGIFAKEVVVGTLDSLYAPDNGGNEASLVEMLEMGLLSIPQNLSAIGEQLTDPLGLDLGDLEDTRTAAADQEVQINTISAMQNLFDGQIGAFAYLLFVLLYMPCVATIGVIYKEIGRFWAIFSVLWSFVVAYAAAVLAYQIGTFSAHPTASLSWIIGTLCATVLLFYALIYWGKRSVPELIPLKVVS